MREINNDRRFVGAWVVDGRGRSGRRWRRKALGALERRTRREWSALYGRQERQREQLAKDCRGVLGRFRLWRELGGGLREIGGARGRQRRERVSLGKAHSEAVRGIERKEGAAYRSGLEGSEDVGGGEDGRAAHCITIILLSIGTRSRAGCGRSGWSRCGRSTESRLTRR